MQACANGIKCIEIIRDGPAIYLNTLDVLIEKHRASLKSISLLGKHEERTKKLDEILKLFLDFPALEELYVDNKIPEEIVINLRNCRVYWSRVCKW